MEIEYRPMRGDGLMLQECLPNCDSGMYDMDIEPDDAEVQDTVTVVWEIR